MWNWISEFLRDTRTPTVRRSSFYRPIIENLEDRRVPIVGAFTALPDIVPGTVFEGVNFDGVVLLQHGTERGYETKYSTGALLWTGRHVLTAAHSLTDDNGVINSAYTLVTFQLAGRTSTIKVPQSGYRIHEGWDGSNDGSCENDIAILDLPELAPRDAPRYDLYRGNAEKGQVGIVVGYGRYGNGDGEDGWTVFPAFTPNKRFGTNHIDDTVFSTGLSPDTPGNDHEYLVMDLDHSGTGWHFELEALPSKGDSGGPLFLAGQIAGVASTTWAVDAFDFTNDSDFGDHAVHTRVSTFAPWIDFKIKYATTTAFTIDIIRQPDGHDDAPDVVDIQRNGESINVWLNDVWVFSELASKLRSLAIIGSDEDETLHLSPDLGIPVYFEGRFGQAELIFYGTNLPDAMHVINNHVQLNGQVVDFLNLDTLTVYGYGGADQFFVGLTGTTKTKPVLWGDGDADTYHIYSTGLSGATLHGEDGVDTFALGTAGLSLDGIGGPVHVDGGAGSDTLTLNDSGDQNTNTFGVYSTELRRGSLPIVTYESIATLSLWAGQKRDTVTVVSRSAATTIDGGGSDDDIFVDPPETSTGLASIGALTLRGGIGNDNLTLRDVATSESFDYTISGTAVTRSETFVTKGGVVTLRSVNIGYDSFATLTFHAGSGNDLIRVTGAAAKYYVHGNGGHDVLIGSTGRDELHGGPGNDILIGGLGLDTLFGGENDDILIAGTYAFAHDNAKLKGLRSTWSRSDLGYTARVSMLRSELMTETVTNDSDADELWGEAGLDWFWGNYGITVSEVKDRNWLGTLEWIR